jgi:transposase-like protein
MDPISYTRLPYPPSIVQHVFWLYLRFNLSLRDVEDLLAERGLDVSYETVQSWVARFGSARFGSAYARRPPRSLWLRSRSSWPT